MAEERALTIARILKRPLFKHARVVAGQGGLSRTIRWVHILESAENASFLNGGEFILSTGIGFGQKTKKHLFYLKEVIRRKAVGLCIELGPYFPEIPPDMIALADKLRFPLIAFTQPVRFVDITLDLHEHIVNIHTKALRELSVFSRDLQQLTLQTHSLPRILNHFQGMIHTQAFFFSLDGPSIAPNMPQAVQSEITELLRSKLALASLPAASGLIPISDKKQILYRPVTAMGSILAYLCVILYEQEPDEFLYLTLDYTAAAIAQILLRIMFAQEQALGNENRLIEDILNGRETNEKQIRETLGISDSLHTYSYWAAVLKIHQEVRYSDEAVSPFHDMLTVFRTILTREGFRPVLHSRGNRLYLLLLQLSPNLTQSEHLSQAMNKIKQSCRQVLGNDKTLLLGVSNVSSDYVDINRSFKEAEQVVAFGAQSAGPFFSNLGVYRLLLQVNDHKSLKSFIDDYLGPLLYHDSEHRTNLLLTLRVFLENGLSKHDTAKKLYIHRQTLYHRLNKIQDIIGEGYLLPQNRLSYELAFSAYDMLYGSK
ncbi:MAG: PucR family transcriptional regulator [Dethiobacter sp.]|jgi:purine catabolism regulator|nr:PucR family transcriptional regulator [Dethiobacter sp.]